MKYMLPFCLLLFVSCAVFIKGPYDRGQFADAPNLKHTIVPLEPGATFTVRQGAFGKGSHDEKGNEFQWDLEVPLGTPVISVDDGTVIYLYQPEGAKGGCDPSYAEFAWGLHIEHSDKTVAQYLHVLATVKVGQKVKKGDVIGKTVWLGWICYPHVHFGVYASRNQMYNSPNRESIPIYFEGIKNGILLEGMKYITPLSTKKVD